MKKKGIRVRISILSETYHLGFFTDAKLAGEIKKYAQKLKREKKEEDIAADFEAFRREVFSFFGLTVPQEAVKKRRALQRAKEEAQERKKREEKVKAAETLDVEKLEGETFLLKQFIKHHFRYRERALYLSLKEIEQIDKQKTVSYFFIDAHLGELGASVCVQLKKAVKKKYYIVDRVTIF